VILKINKFPLLYWPIRIGKSGCRRISSFMKKRIYKAIQKFIKARSYKFGFFARKFWESRAEDMHEKWGSETNDYQVIGQIIDELNVKSLIDFGCGSGRLFNLYLQKNISNVTGIEISSKSIEIAKKHAFDRVNFLCGDILQLNIEDNYDLIISNRTLEHIAPERIEKVISKLCSLSSAIYINEFTDSDYVQSFYSFNHKYLEIFGKYNYFISKQGNIGNQTFFLFKRK